MKRYVEIVPDVLTLCNLAFGFFAIVLAFEGEILFSCVAIVLGGIFDGLDGWSARLVNKSGGIGKELDSFSDMVTFGVGHGVLLYVVTKPVYGHIIAALLGVIPVLFAAIRLAKFNLSESGDKYKGLPSPVAVYVLIAFIIFEHELYNEIVHYNIAILLSITSSVMMLTRLNYVGVGGVIRHFMKKGNIGLIITLFSILFIGYYGMIGLFPIILLFVMSGFFIIRN